MELRLTRLSVQNYRMLKDLQLDGLKGLNIFIGPNATAKSTVLQAAGQLLRSPAMAVVADDCFRANPAGEIIFEGTLSLDDMDLRNVLMRTAIEGGISDPPDSVIGLISEVVGDELEAVFRARAPRQKTTAKQANKELRVQGTRMSSFLASKLSKDEPWIVDTGVGVGNLAALLEAAFEMTMRAKSLLLRTNRSVASLFEGRRVDELSTGNAGPWMLQAKVEDRPEFPEYQDGLRAFLPHVQSLMTTLSSTQQGKFELGAIEEELPGTTPADRWSSGTLHLALTMLGLAALPDGSVMLIEEPELSLHPYALRRLMDRIREAADRGRIQFLLTTHSPVVAEGVKPGIADHTLWRLSRNRDGSAEASPCSTESEVADALDSLLKAEG